MTLDRASTLWYHFFQHQALFCVKQGGANRDEPMCHADEHDVRVRLLVLFVLRRLIG